MKIAEGNKGMRSGIDTEVILRVAQRDRDLKRSGEPIWLDPSLFSATQQAKVKVMEDWGMVYPVEIMQVCLAYEIPLFMECAYIQHESSDGRMTFHNDPTWMRGIDLRAVYPDLEYVNRDTYNIYKLYREENGAQGVGSNGLTHPSIQDVADGLGGCYLPRPNMAAACALFRSQLNSGMTMDQIAARYNPGSPTYAETDKRLRSEWRARFNAVS